jgi:Ca2+-binding RTX toxin-like protein
VPALSGVRHRLAGGGRGPTATSRTSYDAGTPTGARRATCLGRRATIVGTRKGDRIHGTRGADVIVGGGGADRISGLGGKDRICGAAGSDYVVPGGGNDRVDGGPGADTLAVSAGRDRLTGGSGLDWLDYRSSRKGATVSLAAGRATGERWTSMENLVGSRFADRLTGNSGSNQLRGGAGNDVLAGGDGEDMLIGQLGDDSLDGGAGALDFVAHPTASGAVTADLAAGQVTGEGTDRLVGVEGVAGSPHADTLYGGSAASILSGGPGNDTIVGTGTTDILLPMVRGARVDLLGRTASGEGTDTVTGIEVVVGTPGDDVLSGSDADEIFLAGGGADSVSGGGGSDILLGGDGADSLAGGTGDDVLRGDQTVDAADRLDGGDGADVADYGTSTTGVAVSLATGAGPSGDSIGGVETVSGSGHADVISGDAGNNTLVGGPGDDAIAGGAGNDVISGGAGVDALSGEAGADYLTGDEAGGSANGGPDSDVCVDLSPAPECEATEFVGGQAPGGGTLTGARPAQQTGAARSARAVPTNARVPMTDWFGQGNPAVSCNDGLPSTSSVITGYLPAYVRPDYASGNQQTVWVRPEIFDLSNPNTPVETGQWFYNTLNSDQWTTAYWYLYQGLGNDPLDIWRTTFGRNLQTSYAVVYDMWWLDNATGQWLSHDRVRAWHQLGNGFYSDRCAGQAVGYFIGGPSATTPTCANNWTATWCATFRALNASYETPFNYPTTTFRLRPGGALPR